MLPDLVKFIQHCRMIKLPIIYLNHVHHPGANDKGTLADRFPVIRDGKAVRAGTEGVTIWPEIAPQPGDIVIEKIRQSGFMYTRLDATLRELNVVNLLISGVSSGACVESTARDAVSRDYFVYMLSDVTAASGISGPRLGGNGFRYTAAGISDQFRLPPGKSGFDRRIDGRAACHTFGGVKTQFPTGRGRILNPCPYRLRIFLL